MTNIYATIDDVKNYLYGSQAANYPTDDTLLKRLLLAATDFFDNCVGRGIIAQSYTETRNGSDQVAMWLHNYPVTAVASLTINGVAIDASVDVRSWGYVFDANHIYMRSPASVEGWEQWIAGFVPLPNFFSGEPTRFSKGVQNVTVVYTAGYASVPQDIKQAIVELVAWKYKAKDHIGQSTSQTAGVVTTSFVITNIPKEVRMIIDIYRRVTVF